jgi:hypothetical protein
MSSVSFTNNNNSNGAGIMSTVEKTRSRVSERSWVKAQRKEAAKAYKTPNRRASYYSSLYFAARHRERMEEYKQAMFDSTSRGIIKVYFDAYITQRAYYKDCIRESKSWNKPFPLP